MLSSDALFTPGLETVPTTLSDGFSLAHFSLDDELQRIADSLSDHSRSALKMFALLRIIHGVRCIQSLLLLPYYDMVIRRWLGPAAHYRDLPKKEWGPYVPYVGKTKKSFGIPGKLRGVSCALITLSCRSPSAQPV